MRCFACGSPDLDTFHRQDNIPTNSCLLVETETAALDFPTGDMQLELCRRCGFIFNSKFDAEKAVYSDQYEETQGFSPRFVEFAGALAKRWVTDHDLKGKTVVEIGSGKGEFLQLMAQAGIGRGIGIDPGVDIGRLDGPGLEKCEWITDVFSDDLVARMGPHLFCDAIVSRHTLEHIQPVGDFLDSIRRFIDDRTDTVLLFELPDTIRVLEEVAFWDIYYEHCSYFSAGSLARLFRSHGFEVLNLETGYDGQYLILEARPFQAVPTDVSATDDMRALSYGVEKFRTGYSESISSWAERLDQVAQTGGDAMIWGASSKGVSFLSVVGTHVSAAIDINPHKHGKFMAGTGHRIISPIEASGLNPGLVIAMNPVYLNEIRSEMNALGMDGELVAL